MSSDVERCITDACAICEIAAPTGDEGRRAAWVAGAIGAAGLRAEIDDRGSVLARIGGEGAPVAVAAHLDTVFADVADIAVRRDGPVLRAPGIGDNSLGVAALLFLARRWAGREPARPLLLAATVGEEGLGNLRGARGVLEAHRPAELIALEGGGGGELVVRGVGSARFALRVTAPGGHSWRDRAQPSALHVLVGLLAGRLADPGSASCNIGSLHGGAGINVLAPEAEATIEFRDTETARLDDAAGRLAAAAREASRDRVLVEVRELGRRPGGAIDGDHPLVRDALAAAEAAGLGTPKLTESSTDGNAALGEGIPAVTVGLCRSRDAHTREESVDVSALGASLAALDDLVARRVG